MKKTLLNIAACILCWAAVLGIAFGLLCAAASVPTEKLSDNLIKSCDKLAVETPHQATLGSAMNSVRDNYADAILLGIAANMTSDSAVRAALDTRYYDDGYGPAAGIRATFSGYEPNNDYTRYWHGSLVFIRPLLLVTDISGLRLIGALTVAALFVFDVLWLYFRGHRAAAVIFAASAAAVQLWFGLTALEYMPVFVIAFGALPLFVKLSDNDFALTVMAAAVGTLTAFFDFLTAETVTILVPLTAVFFIRAEKSQRANEKGSFILLLRCGAAWLAAYALTFAAKWAAASAFVGGDVSGSAISAAEQRLWGSADSIASPVELFFSAIGSNLTMLTPSSKKLSAVGIVVWLAVFAAVCIVLCRLDKKRRVMPKAAAIVIAALPILRFAVLMNHSYLHSFFTYRALMASIMAVLGLMWYRTVPEPKGKKKESK